jgi:rod shape determining protein RodA
MLATVKELVKKADLFLFGLCVAANLYGIALIYSATRYKASLSTAPLKQGAAMCLGFLCYFLVTHLDLNLLMTKWKWLLGLSVAFILLLRTPLGVSDDTGNLSWLHIPGIPFNLQPAEFVKLTFILLLAKQIVFLQESRRGISTFPSVVFLGSHVLFMVALIFVISGDLGMATVYCFIFVIMCWAGRVNKWWFLSVGGGLAGAAAVLWNFVLPKYEKLWTDYRIMRFRVVLDHDLDPQDKGWQQSRSLLAIGSGQLTGKGYLNGTQTQSTYNSTLPARHTDFIFDDCGEELGMVGCCVLLLLLSAIILRCFWVGLHTDDTFSALVAIGVGGMLLTQVIMNVAMCLYVAPVIGITLPFFSYGGSSILTMYIAMGMVSGIRARVPPSWLRDRQS